MSTEIFTGNQENQAQPNPLDQLVGEGKKFKTVEDLVKSYTHSQSYIEQLQGENSGLREELSTRQGAEDLFRKIVENKPEPAQPDAAPKVSEPNPVGEPEKVDLAQLVRAELEAHSVQQRQAENAKTVLEGLVKHFGSEEEAQKAVQEKAAELGVTTQFLQDVALKSPTAFFNTVGINPNPKDTDQPVLRPDVNTAAFSSKPSDQGAPGTKDYFERLRKENPSAYWDPSVQNQIYKATLAGTYKP